MVFSRSNERDYEAIEDPSTDGQRPDRQTTYMLFAIPALCLILVWVSVGGRHNTTPTATTTPSAQQTGKVEAYINPAAKTLFESLNPTMRLPSDVGTKVHEEGMKFFFHIADTHIDPFFDATMSMAPGQCHSCKFSNKAHGNRAYCPTTLPKDEAHVSAQGYAFGRYKCNPPRRLADSLYHNMKKIDPNPKFIVHTGDIAPHGYPDDGTILTARTKLSDLCQTKLLIIEQQLRLLRSNFPNTKFAFSLGNNDHFPKNTYWQPFITWFADTALRVGFFTKAEHEMMIQYGSFYVDVDGLRFLCVDFTLFIPGGETNFVPEKELEGLNPEEREEKLYPVRCRTSKWIGRVLADARKEGKVVYLVAHQPLATKKGKDEMDVDSTHYALLKETLDEYQDIVRIGFFGHRNYAGLQPILNSLQRPIIPTITVPGVSPRGMNQPSFNIMFYDPESYTIMDFEQWIFNLAEENVKAVAEGPQYLGTWRMHHRDLFSWRALSDSNFTIGPLVRVLHNSTKDMTLFFRYEMWKRAGYIGDETPENYNCKALYDENESMMRCLFKNQEPECWDRSWLA